jgi:hypothetical protein
MSSYNGYPYSNDMNMSYDEDEANFSKEAREKIAKLKEMDEHDWADFAEHNANAGEAEPGLDYDEEESSELTESSYYSTDSSFSSTSSSLSSTSSSLSSISSSDYSDYLRRRNGLPQEPRQPKQPANVWKYVNGEMVPQTTNLESQPEVDFANW